MRRRLVLHSDDVLIVGGLELDVTVLMAILNADSRLLWAFIKSEDGEGIQPIAISEERCIWLLPGDLERKELPSAV